MDNMINVRRRIWGAKVKKASIVCAFFVFSFVNFCYADSTYTMPTGTGLPENSSGIKGILTNFLLWLLIIVGVIGLIGFVISGIMYMTSFGDDERMKTAKNAMFYSILGVIMALSGYIVVKAIDTALRGSGML